MNQLSPSDRWIIREEVRPAAEALRKTLREEIGYVRDQHRKEIRALEDRIWELTDRLDRLVLVLTVVVAIGAVVLVSVLASR